MSKTPHRWYPPITHASTVKSSASSQDVLKYTPTQTFIRKHRDKGGGGGGGKEENRFSLVLFLSLIQDIVYQCSRALQRDVSVSEVKGHEGDCAKRILQRDKVGNFIIYPKDARVKNSPRKIIES